MKQKLKVMSVVGTRPEAIKMSIVVKKLALDPEIDNVVCVTAQHREMLDQVADKFSIHADYDLNLMKEKQSLADITSMVLYKLTPVLLKERPDLVLVQGDTTTAFSAALAAFYQQIPVGHVEAGLRTYDCYSPFPEEMNRQLVSRIAALHFCPTKSNEDNLKSEKITKNVFVTGNTVIDIVQMVARQNYKFENKTIGRIDFNDGHQYITLTAHRRENLGQPLRNICLAVKNIVSKFPNVRVIWPVHLNPAVRDTVFSLLSGIPSIYLVDPLNVFDMHNLIYRSYFIMTDSGGLQEEGPSLGKPVLVLRSETERPEAISAGTVKLVGTEKQKIVAFASKLLEDENQYMQMANAVNPYGDGHASDRIINIIKAYFHDNNIVGESDENTAAKHQY